MNTDTIINMETKPNFTNKKRRKYICIYNIKLFINDLITILAFSFVVYGAYLIHTTIHSDYTECSSTKYLKRSSFAIGSFAIVIGLIYGISSLFIARPAFLNDTNDAAEGMHFIYLTILAISGPIALGIIIGTTGNLYKTYDSLGCNENLYGMSFVGLYVVFLIVWIFIAIGIALLIIGLIMYGIIGGLVVLIYSIFEYLITISCKDIIGCYIKYVPEQPTQLSTGRYDTGQNSKLPYNTECPICLTLLNDKNADTFKILSCNHTVCKICLNQMTAFNQSITCPLCRVSIISKHHETSINNSTMV